MPSSSDVPSSPVTAPACDDRSARWTRHPPQVTPGSSRPVVCLRPSDVSSKNDSSEVGAGGSSSIDTKGHGTGGATPSTDIAALPFPLATRPSHLRVRGDALTVAPPHLSAVRSSRSRDSSDPLTVLPFPSAAIPSHLRAGGDIINAATSSSVDDRAIRLQSLIASTKARRSFGERSKRLVGATREILRLYAESRFGISPEIADGVRTLYSLLPEKHKRDPFEVVIRRRRPTRARRPTGVEGRAFPSVVLPGAADSPGSPAPPGVESCDAPIHDVEGSPSVPSDAMEPSAVASSGPYDAFDAPDFVDKCDQALLVKLAPQFVNVKRTIMDLAGCGWREYVDVASLRDVLNRARPPHVHAESDSDHFDAPYHGVILFSTMNHPARGSASAAYVRCVEGAVDNPRMAALGAALDIDAAPLPMHVVAIGFDVHLRFESKRRRAHGHDVTAHAFDQVFDRTGGTRQRCVIDCQAFFLTNPVPLPPGVSISRQKGSINYRVPEQLRAPLFSACESIPLGPHESERPSPLSPAFMRASAACSAQSARDFSFLSTNGWQLCDRLRLSEVQQLQARAAAYFFTAPEVLHYWADAGLLSVVASDSSVASDPDPSKNQQLMLLVEGIEDFLESDFDCDDDVGVIQRAATAACTLFGLDPSPAPALAGWLLSAFDSMYFECLGPATFSLTRDYPIRHPHRNMIFSLNGCDQHPHVEVNDYGEEDRLFGVVGFNIPAHTPGATPSDAPTLVRTTVVLDTSAVTDWHDGRQVTPECCDEFAPLVVREAVVHHGVASADRGHLRIALHQAFASESAQMFCFNFLNQAGAHIADVHAACERQSDWRLRVEPSMIHEIDYRSTKYKDTGKPRRRIPKRASVPVDITSLVGTAPTSESKSKSKSKSKSVKRKRS